MHGKYKERERKENKGAKGPKEVGEAEVAEGSEGVREAKRGRKMETAQGERTSKKKKKKEPSGGYLISHKNKEKERRTALRTGSQHTSNKGLEGHADLLDAPALAGIGLNHAQDQDLGHLDDGLDLIPRGIPAAGL